MKNIIDPEKVKKLEPKEKSREARLKKSVKEANGICLKYYNKGNTGWPDDVILLPGGVTWWVELKKPGKTAEPLQIERGKQLQALGHNYALLDTDEKLNTFIINHLDPVKICAKTATYKIINESLNKYF